MRRRLTAPLRAALYCTLAALSAVTVVMVGAADAPAATGLGACPFWTNATPPPRTPGPGPSHSPEAPQLDESHRAPAPGGIHGALASGKVSITFNRVAGAKAYRVWRNSQSVAWLTDEGQSTFTATDTTPCDHAFYNVAVLTDTTATDASTGQLSQAYQLGDDGQLAPWAFANGSTMTVMATSYNDVGQTASGYNTQPGICAVDPRVIPWGQRFYVPGYGYCYASDIGTWIQNKTVDLWIAGTESNNWGVQTKTITFVSPTSGGGSTLLSKGKPALASSEGGSGYVAKNAFDGSTSTRWASVAKKDPQWLRVDLGSKKTIHKVKLIWDLSCARSYKIQVSNDGSTFTTVYSTTTGPGGTESISVSTSGRYVRMYGTVRCRSTGGYSLQEMQVYS
jgi:3D (Asp-Asp-Asp) domain-containing protein